MSESTQANASASVKHQLHPIETIVSGRIVAAAEVLQDICGRCSRAAGWHINPATNKDYTPTEIWERKNPYFGAKIALMHSELSEALEGHRRGIKDDKLPERSMVEVELADAIIRIFDMAFQLNADVGGAIADKLRYNSKRSDHQLVNRAKDGGKGY